MKDQTVTPAPRMIAVIPARSGSKGLRDKNIRPLNGKPLIAYSIEAAKESGLFDTIHVSTDSQQYSDLAAEFGADQPFLRDAANAQDASSSWDAVREVLRKYEALGKKFDLCVLLQPTSPMRTGEDIRAAFSLLREKGARCLTGVTPVDHPVQWCFTLDDTMAMTDLARSPYKDCRRQELEPHYRENGAVYIVRTEDLFDPDFEFYTPQCVAYVMPGERSIDIDTLQDFVIAEALMRQTAEEG